MSLYIDINKNLSSFKLDVFMEGNGEIIGFLGASGSGKSMTLKCIAGLEKPISGKIIINDKVLYDSEKGINIKTQERKVGFLFQNYALFPHMTIKENIEIGLGSIDKKEKSRLSATYIKKFNLEGLEKRYPWQLSGGQQQRVALARALITSPEILLLDEPFSALDNYLRTNMERELVELLKDFKGTVIFVTHDIEEAFRVSDKIIVFDNGKANNIRNKNQLFETPSSLAEAKLTGCKNISKAKKIDSKTIFAEEWGVKLNTLNELDKEVNYIAIRSHNIKLYTEDRNINGFENILAKEDYQKSQNVIDVRIENIIENPFNYTIYVKAINGNCDKLINYTINKEEMKFKINDIIKIVLESEYLFCF